MSKKYLFGVKYLIPYDQTTMKPKGIFEVISGVEVGRENEQLLLTGGHKDGPYAVEAGEPQNSLTATIKEYPNFAFSLFENAEITESSAETAGFVGTPANKVGTSVIKVDTGIASISVTATKGAEVPNGFLVLEAVSATTIDVYLAGDVAAGRIPVVSELPKIASGVTITGTAGTTDLAGYGLTITGGSGVVAFTIGDMAYVDVRTANTSKTSIKVGEDSAVSYFGLLLVYPKNSQKEQVIVRFPNVAAIGMPFNGNTREFSEFEQAMTPMLDDTENILYEIIRIKTE